MSVRRRRLSHWPCVKTKTGAWMSLGGHLCENKERRAGPRATGQAPLHKPDDARHARVAMDTAPVPLQHAGDIVSDKGPAQRRIVTHGVVVSNKDRVPGPLPGPFVFKQGTALPRLRATCPSGHKGKTAPATFRHRSHCDRDGCRRIADHRASACVKTKERMPGRLF